MALCADLISALRTVPQDPERFLVLADRLQVAGDVRGELIMLQARRAEFPENVAFALAEERYLQDHSRVLLGRLWSSPSSINLAWELGFIRHAMIWAVELEEPQRGVRTRIDRPGPRRRTGKLGRRVADLLELESAALLESLTLGMPRSEVQRARVLDAVAEVAAAAPPTVRLLQVRDLINSTDGAGWYAPQAWHLPDYEPSHLREVTWRGRALTISADAFPIGDVVEVLGAWEKWS